MNNKLILCLIVLLCISNSEYVRYLQWNDPNCAQWNLDGSQCLKCSPRTYNNTQFNRCIQVDDNCKTWDTTNGQCLTCYDGYGTAFKNGKAINGNCPFFNQQNITNNQTQIDQNCQCYDQNRICIMCYPGYILINQTGMCQLVSNVTNITNCKIIGMNGQCIQCQDGYYLDMNNSCIELPENCTKVDIQGNCTQCQTGFTLVNATCQPITVQGPPISYCQTFASGPGRSGKCVKCVTGYYIAQNGQCQILPQGCQQADQSGACTLCKQGYYLNTAGDCEQLPSHCTQADQNGICVVCQTGYYVNNQKMCNQLPPNCQQATPKGKCKTCAQGFYQSNGICKMTINNGTLVNQDCATQGANGQCLACRQFYKLKNGNCIPTGENPFCMPGACQCGTGLCLQCQQGYFLDNNNICIQIGQNCANYSMLTGKCTQCLDNFTLISGQCVPIKSPNITVTNLQCKQQDEMGNCLSCRRYYELVNQTCIPVGINPKCRMYNQYHQCICCYYSHQYYLDYNHICVPKNSNCLQFDIQTGQCTECFAEDVLQNGKCINIVSQQQMGQNC